MLSSFSPRNCPLIASIWPPKRACEMVTQPGTPAASANIADGVLLGKAAALLEVLGSTSALPLAVYPLRASLRKSWEIADNATEGQCNLAEAGQTKIATSARPSVTMAAGRALDVTVEVTDAGGLRVLVTPLMAVAHRLRTLAATETLELSGLIVARRE